MYNNTKKVTEEEKIQKVQKVFRTEKNKPKMGNVTSTIQLFKTL
jgi:hypothetical protein